MDRRPALVALRALGLGDFLTAVPALRALGRAFPDHHRILLAPTSLQPLLAGIGQPWDLVAADGKDGLDPGQPLAVDGAVDVAVNLHGRGPQSHELLRRLRPGRLIAFRAPDDPDAAGPRWLPAEPETVRWCRLLREHGIPAGPGELDLVPPPVPPLAGGDDVTLIHVGAASASRRWPLERWAAVAAAERHAGRRVFLTGGKGERADARAVAQGAGLPEEHLLAGRTDLATLAATVAAAGRVVTGDTGIAHLATALGTPSVVLFGPSSPRRWGPPADRRDRHVALWHGLEGNPLGDEPDPALLRITPEEVIAALRALPGAVSRRRPPAA